MASVNDPIFVIVRNDVGEIYPSYTDYWELIRLSEFATCELDEVEPESTNTYIFSPANGNVLACCERPHKAKYIHWNIEIPLAPNEAPKCFDETWVSCRYVLTQVIGNKKFVVMGGHPGLYREPSEDKRWDFCHTAYIYGKRAQQVADLEAQGYTMAPAGFGEIRDEAIAKSRWGLIMHQHDVPAMSPQRMTLFSCRKLPMVIEPSDFYPYEGVTIPAFSREIDFTEMINKNYHYFTEEMTFRRAVEGAL